ncbi:MAG: hypothetical protein QM537_04515 [Candidatus Symbiobacter sp.]|nr:hypothetical protein [Candidatus Symbiobacter sp.]
MANKPNEQEAIRNDRANSNTIINNHGTLHFGNIAESPVLNNSTMQRSVSQSHTQSFIVSIFADKQKTIWFLVIAWVATILAGALGNILSETVLRFLRDQ